ncbi:MAG: ABC transporter ATP-binding protein [Oscillospiraceae bacterium]|nr:ABC transporter ATP-binding protein [Oscillospiraceae bacterium]
MKGMRGPGRVPDEKPRNVKSSMAELFKYLKPWYKAIAAALILSLAGTALNLIAPDKMADLTNTISDGLATGIDMAAIIKAIIIVLTIYVSASLVTCASNYVMITVMQKLAWNMRSSISEKINRMPLKYFDKVSVGDVLSRITNDVDTVSSALNSSITTLVQAVVQFIGVTIIMFATSGRLALTAIASSLLGFALMFSIIKRSRRYFRQQQKNLGDMNGHIEEMYSGHDIVRVYGAVKQAKDEFGRINENLYSSSWKSQFFGGLMQPFMGFIGNFGYVAVCVVGAALTMSGAIRFGTIVAFISYVKLFTNPLTQISQAANSLMSAGAAGERVFGFLNEEEMPDDSMCTAKLDDIRGEVEFDHVRFGYDEDKPVINDFSAKIEPGQKVAIVGYTGAGKTTMVNLLMRFYELWSGSIKIDGVPISEMKRSDIHSMFGMVLQDTWLFEGSYRENIAYGNKDVTDEQVKAACRLVGMDHFIMTLPDGYDTVLSDRSSLSTGQRQLLTIARAMVENAPMIILDEATSSVDTRTEALVQRAMDKLTEGRTSFVIAHRLSTIRDADLILVMDKGDVVESGTHKELLARDGLYRELYNSQFENG